MADETANTITAGATATADTPSVDPEPFEVHDMEFADVFNTVLKNLQHDKNWTNEAVIYRDTSQKDKYGNKINNTATRLSFHCWIDERATSREVYESGEFPNRRLHLLTAETDIATIDDRVLFQGSTYNVVRVDRTYIDGRNVQESILVEEVRGTYGRR